MVDFLYEKQGGKTKLVYRIAPEDDITFSSMNKLIDKKIPGFAPVRFAMKNGQAYLEYDVAEKITVKEFFSGCAKKKQIVGFFCGITNAFISAEDSAIEKGTVVLDLDHMYIDPKTQEVCLIALPVLLEGQPSDCRLFLRRALHNLWFDQTENCGYIAQLANYLNDESKFLLTGFRSLLEGMEDRPPEPEANKEPDTALHPQPQFADDELYRLLQNGLENMQRCIPCPPVAAERINEVLHRILLEHPEMCHFEGEWYWENGVAPVYTLSATQRNELARQAEKCLWQLQIDSSASVHTKVAVVYRWLANHVAYDRTAIRSQSAYGALVDRSAVCKGISKAYQLLLQRLHIRCELVEGSLDGIMKHVWVRYRADNTWYHSDITMAYPQFYSIAITGGIDYVAATVQQIRRTHTIWGADNMLEQQKECYFQSLEKQNNRPHNPLPNVPASLRKLVDGGNAQFLAAGSVSDVYRFGSRVLKRVFCGEDLSKLYYAMRECAMLQKVSGCPSVAGLFGWDVMRERDGYVVYMVLRYGQPLEEYCRQTNLSPKEAVALVKGACVALEGCYAAGVAHMDIQPGNLLVEGFHRSVILTDFSSAVPVEEVNKLEQVRGTPAYVAPEIYHYRAYSQRADVYSLGILLYCLLNDGKLPYGDQHPVHEAVQKRIEGLPVKLNGERNPALRLCVETACSFDPRDRYPDLQSFRSALEKVQSALDDAGTMPYSPARGFVYPSAPPPSSNQPIGYPSAVRSTWNAPTFCADTIGETTVLGPPAVQSTETPARVDQVQFSAVAPQKAMKGEYTLVQIFMYEQAFRSAVEEALQMRESPMQEKKSGIYHVRDKTLVKVVISSRDIDIAENVVEEPWNGGYLCFDFALDIPQNCTKHQILLTAAVYFDGVPATRLMMTLRLQTQYEQRLQVIRNDVLSAFVSYASQDRGRVASLIQGMKKARPDMDIFFDINSLRSGENWEEVLRAEVERRDVLFLCWSQNSKISPWVDMEWRYAMERKGIDAIEPIPIDPPDICPPPHELQSKHFNDSLLYIINK